MESRAIKQKQSLVIFNSHAQFKLSKLILYDCKFRNGWGLNSYWVTWIFLLLILVKRLTHLALARVVTRNYVLPFVLNRDWYRRNFHLLWTGIQVSVFRILSKIMPKRSR